MLFSLLIGLHPYRLVIGLDSIAYDPVNHVMCPTSVCLLTKTCSHFELYSFVISNCHCHSFLKSVLTEPLLAIIHERAFL